MTSGLERRGRAERETSPLFDSFMTVLDGIDRLTRYLIIVCMAIMVVLVSTQVFARYALAHSIDWAEEMSRLFFVWSVFLAIPHGIRQGVHVGIDIAVRKLSPEMQANLFRALSVLAGALFVLVFVQAVSAAIASWGEMMPTVDVTASVFYIAVIIAAGHSFLHLIPMAVYGPKLIEPHEAQEGAPE